MLAFLHAWSFLVVVVDIVILLPLSMFRRLRPHTGGLLYLSSYLFGLVTWLYGFIVTCALWGGFAVVIGLMFFGVGVVLWPSWRPSSRQCGSRFSPSSSSR